MKNAIQEGAVQEQRGAKTEQHVGAMECDGMGCGFEGEGKGGRSARGPKQLFAGGDAPIQRKPLPYDTLDKENKLVKKHAQGATKVMKKIDEIMEQKRDMALNWGMFLNNSNKHLALWAKTAQEYFSKPSETPDFIHARFGYAVEALTCMEVPDSYEDLKISFQVATGHTRPDIVLYSEEDGQIAWIDITSADSAGHIKGKDGSGWSSRPFVWELLYKPLDLNEVLKGMNDPVYREIGGYLATKNQIKYEEETKNRTLLQNTLTGLQEKEGWVTGYGNAGEKQRETREHLKDKLGMDLGNSLQGTKGALAEADISDGAFGFNRYYGGQDTSIAKEWIRTKSASEIKRRSDELDKKTYKEVEKVLGKDMSNGHPLVFELLQTFHEGANQSTFYAAITVKNAVERERALKDTIQKLSGIQDGRAGIIGKKLKEHLEGMPEEYDFEVVRKWVANAESMLQVAYLLPDALKIQKEFLVYLGRKYGNMDFFKRTKEETKVVEALSRIVEDDKVLKFAVQWMSDHPVKEVKVENPNVGNNLFLMPQNTNQDHMVLEDIEIN